MLKSGNNEKGIMLFMVLVTLFIVVILANGILSFILSQFRHTHHQVNRIRAYYAALAGMNLAIDNLRTGTWGIGSYKLCTNGCSVPDVNDGNIPYNVTVDISGSNITNCTINLTVDYTYTP